MSQFSSKLSEAIAAIERGTIGFWIDNDGKATCINDQLHEEWAREHGSTSADLLWNNWARVRVYGTAVMVETNKLRHLHDAIDLANEYSRKEIIFAYKGRPTVYFKRTENGWADESNNDIEWYLQTESKKNDRVLKTA